MWEGLAGFQGPGACRVTKELQIRHGIVGETRDNNA